MQIQAPAPTETKAKPKIFYGWFIVGASVAMNFYLSIAFFNGFQVFFMPILGEFGWSRALTSGAYSLRQLESGLLAPFLGFFVDRFGARAIILWGVIIGGAGMVMLSFINSVWTFYAALLIISIGTSGASHGVSWPVVIANWFHRLQGRAMGLAMLGPVVAGPFVFLVALMEQSLTWRPSLFILGIGLWVVGIPLALMARSDPRKYGQLPDGEGPEAHAANADGTRAASKGDDAGTGFSVRQALVDKSFWMLSLLFGVQFLGTSGLMVHMIPLLEDANYGRTESATMLGMVFLLSGIGRIGAGIIADMLNQRLVTIGLLLAQAVGLAILLTVGPSEYAKIGAFALLFGIGFGGMIPLRPYLLRRFFGRKAFGAIQGLTQGIAVVMGVVGPVFFGQVFDVTGSYDIAIYASIVVILLAIPFAFLLDFRREYATASAT